MGYYASFGGQVKLNAEKLYKDGYDTDEKIEKIAAKIVDDTIEEDMTFFKDDLSLQFGGDGKYYEDSWHEFLSAIKPYTESGEITFNGEDDWHWRFVFKSGEWKEENGAIVYGGVYAIYLINHDADSPYCNVPLVHSLLEDEEQATTIFEQLAKKAGKGYILAFLPFGSGISAKIIKEVEGNV